MGLVRGRQIATGSDGIETRNLIDNILSASAEGRGKIQDGFFDVSTATAKFTTSSIPNNRLVDPVLALSGGTMTGDLVLAGAPATDNSAARKVDVDRAVQGLDVKLSVRLKSEANIPDTGSITLSDFDGTGQGITLVAGDRVLLTDQTASAQNGIYQVVGTALTRSSDADEDSEVTANLFTFVEEGTVADTGWVLVTDDPITVGTTGLTFSQFSGVGSVTFGSTISQIQAGVSAGAGTSSNAARSDHTHSVDTAAGTNVSATGSNAEGSSNSLARADHIHAVLTAAGPGMSLSSSNAVGTAEELARADHDHAFLANEAAQSLSLTSSNTVGTSDHFAHADHTHVLDVTGLLSASDGLATQVATASLPGTALSGARADHVHEAPSWTEQNKGMAANDTTNNGQGELATNGAIAATALDSYVEVKINGINYRVGDSTNSASTPCYFSNDGGVTGLDPTGITSGSLLYWNGDVAGFRLKTGSDLIDFCYLAFADNS